MASMPFHSGQSGNPAGRPVSLETLVSYFHGANRVVNTLCDAALAGNEEALQWLRKAYLERDMTYRADDGHGGMRG